MEQKQEQNNRREPLRWDPRIELKWIDFLKNDEALKRDSGILQHKTAIALIRKFMTTPREDINVADTQAALFEAIEQYGINNKTAFTMFKDCVESYSKIQLVNSRLLTVSDYNYEKAITSIGQADKRLIDALDQRGFVPDKDKELLRELLKEGETWRNKWHHNTPPSTDTENLAGGCKAWFRYIFAVAAICFHYNKSRGGVLFTADRDCLLTFTQPEVNPGKQSQFKAMKGVTFQIDGRPGGFQLEISVTEPNGRSRMETRTGEIQRDKYIDIRVQAETLGRGGVPHFAANPLLAGMAKPANEAGIPFQGGTYRGQTNERQQPHGIGTFTRDGISYGGRFNEGRAEGSFLVKGEGFKYRGTLSFDTMPWGLGKGEMTLTLANGQRYIYKEATFWGLHCLRGSLFLDGKLWYKGEFAPPAEGMMPIPRGKGELHATDGSVYYGEVDNNLPYGQGCLVSDSGTRAIYTDWIEGEPTESIDTMRKILISGDRPAWLFDGDCIVCPVSGAPLTFYYIGSPRLTLRDESGATLTCPDTEEWNYRFGSPATQPEPKPEPRPAAQTRPEPKPTAEPEKRTSPAAHPRPAQAGGERKEIRQPANEIEESRLNPEIGNNKKWGFVNEQKRWIIPSRFDYAWGFIEGLAAVRVDGKWGFIDKRGKFVIPLRFTRASWFAEGLAAVRTNDDKWGFIDKRGDFTIQPRFDHALEFAEGLAGVRVNGKWGFIDKRGDFVISPRFEETSRFAEGLAPVMMDEKWGFINKQGRIVIPIQYDEADPFIQGKAQVEQNGEWFDIGKQGNRIGEPEQPRPAQADGERKETRQPANEEKGQELILKRGQNGWFGFVDKQGNWIVKPQFDAVDSFSDGLACVRKNWKYGFINEQGAIVIPLKFDFAFSFYNGINKVQLNGEWFYIDKQGNRLGEPAQSSNEKKEQKLTEKKGENGKYGYVDEQGHWVIQPRFDDAQYFSEGLASVEINDKYGFIDKRGNFVIQPQFNYAWSFSEGLASVEINDKYGFIDKRGNLVIQPQFDFTDEFSEGLAAVGINGKCGFIDKRGNFIIRPQFDFAWSFSEGLASVEINDKCGFIDKRGNFIIRPQFDFAWKFSEGLVVVEINDKWGYVNTKGQEVVPIIYDKVDVFEDHGLARVQKNGQYGYVDTRGKLVVPVQYSESEALKKRAEFIKYLNDLSK